MCGVRGCVIRGPKTYAKPPVQRVREVEAVHVFSLAGPARHREAGRHRAPWWALLSWLLGDTDEAALTRDPYGRVAGTDSDVDIAVCAEEERQFVALARGTSVAISGRRVPGRVDALSLLPFSAPERSFIAAAPMEMRASRLTRLWTRKEATLRLSGGGFSRADLVDVLCEEREGRVVVPDAGRSSWLGPDVAFVHEVPDDAGVVVSVATSCPVREVFVWQLDRMPVTA